MIRKKNMMTIVTINDESVAFSKIILWRKLELYNSLWCLCGASTVFPVNSSKTYGHTAINTLTIFIMTFTSSTCSVVNGPPYLCFPKSNLDGRSSSQYVNALILIGFFI